jgi:transketolase N-terminal domain/subunit
LPCGKIMYYLLELLGIFPSRSLENMSRFGTRVQSNKMANPNSLLRKACELGEDNGF